mgnify:CR=1 FL=1
MIDMQKFVDAIDVSARSSRKDYHLTLGKAIAMLESLPTDMQVKFDCGPVAPYDPHSYRGYYSDLAFERGNDTVLVSDFLSQCRAALGAVFEGYKGGDFTMDNDTPLWASEYGRCSGIAIIDLQVREGMAVLVTKQIDE